MPKQYCHLFSINNSNKIKKVINDLSEEWSMFNIETIYGKMRKILGYKITYGENSFLKEKW